MVPYTDFYYFYILALVLIPAVVMGLLGVKLKWYGLAASIFMIHLIYSDSPQQMSFFIFFFVYEVLLILIFSQIIKKFRKRPLLWIFLLLAVAPLIGTKLGDASIITTTIGFLGISYLTFKILQVLIQLYDRIIEKLKLFDLLYFILFFPTLSSGPIDRSQRFMEDSDKKLTRKEYQTYLGDGIFKIMLGIAYKFIIAYLIQQFVNRIPAHNHATLLLNIEYMYSYSLYLFFDFAGYSLLAVGASYILGIKTPDNFNLPFLSRDIKDFWNRWHMSLSFWFRDFIYNRFVMSALKNKWFKNKYTASSFGFLITMTVMGFWHGFFLYYILYGLYHGILIIATDWFQRKSAYKKLKKKAFFHPVSVIITFNLICFGFYIFSGYAFK